MKNNRKGFTIVELVIVIAVIAILAAVLIPTFVSLNRKAQVASDTALVKNLNTALASKVEGCKTMSEALTAAAEFGFDVAKINAKASANEILWDSVNNVFCYFDSEKGEIAYIPDFEGAKDAKEIDYWVIASTPSTTYSTYIYGYEGTDAITTATGIDVSAYEGLDVNFTTDAAVTATVVTNGGNLTIKAANANVNHYGYASVVTVDAVKGESYHIFGTVQFVEIKSGRVEIESGASVNAVFAATAGVKVDVVSGATVTTVAAPADVEVTVTGATLTTGDKASIEASATLFAGGLGTEAKPYLIADAEQLKNIGTKYDTYAYYKVMDGVKTIDCAGVNRINLNGSFNGNGATLANVDGVLFNYVGTGAESKAVVIENFTVMFEGGAGVVRVCATPTLTFKNVTAIGYLIEDWNGAVFLRYGTENYNMDDVAGFDYTVNFENCASSAELYSSQNAYSSILVGHAYQGAGHTATINVDKATDAGVNGTTLYYTGADKVPFGYKYYGAQDGAAVVVKVDGADADKGKITGETVVPVTSNKHPAKGDNAWTLDTESDITKVIVKLNFQYTLWTENYADKIDGQAGVGGQIGDEIVLEVKNGETVDVFSKITAIEIKTGSDKWDYEIKNGKLIIYMTADNQYVDGTVKVIAEQYTSGSNIAKYKGTATVVSKDASKGETEWSIK